MNFQGLKGWKIKSYKLKEKKFTRNHKPYELKVCDSVLNPPKIPFLNLLYQPNQLQITTLINSIVSSILFPFNFYKLNALKSLNSTTPKKNLDNYLKELNFAVLKN